MSDRWAPRTHLGIHRITRSENSHHFHANSAVWNLYYDGSIAATASDNDDHSEDNFGRAGNELRPELRGEFSRLEDTPFGDDAGDQFGRRDVEGWVVE